MMALRVGRRQFPTIAIILMAYVALAVAYGLIVPLGEGPDEAPHFTVIRYIVQHGRLPSTNEEHEAFQPPLYYVMGAGLVGWINLDGYIVKANADFTLEPGRPKNLLVHDSSEAFPYRGPALAWHLLRLFSTFCGCVTVWATYQLGRTALPKRPAVALAAAALCAFAPAFLFLSGLVNNDNLAAALAALLLWQTARVARGRRSPWTLAGLGALLGLGVLTKLSVGVTAFPVSLAILYAAWRSKRRPGAAIWNAAKGVASVALVAMLVSGWWFARNLALHHDLTGWSFILQTNAVREGGLTPAVLLWLIQGLFKSFWFAWMGITLPGAVYAGALALSLAALGGLMWGVLRRRARLDGAAWAILGLCGVQICLVGASLLQWTATVLGTDQARLLYPALPALTLLLALGLQQWMPRRYERWAAFGLVGLLLALAVATPIVVLRPAYAGSPVVSSQSLQERASPADVPFGDAVRLVGYGVITDSVRPGANLEVELFWRAERPITQDVWLTLTATPADGSREEPVATKDGTPSAGRDTTDQWAPGSIVAARHVMQIPEWAPAGRYNLALGLHPFGGWEWLPAGARQQIRVDLLQFDVIAE